MGSPNLRFLVQYSTVQYSTVQYSTVQHSTAQYSTVQYSTVQYSTVQYSTVQYNTAQRPVSTYLNVSLQGEQHIGQQSLVDVGPPELRDSELTRLLN